MQTKFYLANTYEYLIYQHFDNKNQANKLYCFAFARNVIWKHKDLCVMDTSQHQYFTHQCHTYT